MRRRRGAWIVLVAAVLGALLATAGPASSAGGALDTTFGTSGALTIDRGSTSDDVVTDLAQQSDGKIVVAVDAGTGFALSRLTTAGVVDTAFGTSGTVTGTFMIDVPGIALDGDGKIVVVGTTAASNGNLVLARYSAAGVLDTAFGTAGIVEVSMSGTASGGRDVLVQSDGTIIVLAADDGELVLMRFSTLGVVDTSFATAGTVETGAEPGPSDRVVRQSSSGGFLVTGVIGDDPVVVRFTSTGAADPTFGPDGAATAAGVVRGLALQSDGKILTAGDDGSTKATVTRFTTAGVLDTTFATTGQAAISVPGLSLPSARAIAVQSDAKILVAGRRDDSADASAIFVARLTTAGAVDTTFATSGIATFTIAGGNGTSTAQALDIDSTGRALVGGSVVDSTEDIDATVLRVTTADGQTSSTTTSTTTATTTTTGTGDPVSAGGTVRSHAAGTLPTATIPLTIALTSPVAGTAVLTEIDDPASEFANLYTLAKATITAPTATAEDPLVLTLSVFRGTIPAAFPVGSLVVVREGVDVPLCEVPEVAVPDPCVESTTITTESVSFRILTSAGSSWVIGVPGLERLAGDDRVASAIDVSQSLFVAQGASAVVLARADAFADALAATPLAAHLDAPLLLTATAALDDAVLAEIIRVLPAGGNVYLLGGTAALSDAVAERLHSWGFATTRYAGTDRYATAVAIAERGLGAPTIVVETTGLSFADALTAGAVATRQGGAVLLTAGSQQSAATAGYLARYGPTRHAIGGPAALADPAAEAIVGTDRYETAVLAAIRFFDTPEVVGFASGLDYPDALAGGAHVAQTGGPLLLVPSTGELPVSLTIYLDALEASPPLAFLYGGTGAVDGALETLLATALGLL